MASVSHPRVGSKTAAGLVVIAGILLFMPGLSALPPIDRDESRFAEASRYMLESGEWIIPRVEGQPRLNKPPLIYWLQAASVWICQPKWSPEHGGIWAYRLPSALATCGVMLLTCRLGTSMFTPSVGVWAALLLGSSMVLMVDGRQARADEVLLLSVMLSQFALWRIWDRTAQGKVPGLWMPILLWSALGAGILTKGPVAPAITGLTVVSLCVGTHEFRWLRSLRIGYGLGLLVVIVLPWVWMAADEVGWARLGDEWYREVFVRASTAQEGHGGWPGSFLLLLPVLFWPGSLTLIPLIRHIWRRGMPGRNRPPRRAELFCLAWFVPGLLIFELAGTKLPHYILPVFPPLALLAARSLFAVRQGWNWVTVTYVGRYSLWAWLALTQAVGVGPLIALAWFGQLAMRREVVIPLVGVILIGQILAVATIFAAGQRQWRLAQGLAIALAGLMHCGSYAIVLPNLEQLWLSSRISAEIHRVDPEGQRPLAAAGYSEDSLVFLTQGRLRRLSWRELSIWLSEHPDALIVVGEIELGFLLERAPEQINLPPYRRLASVTGFNYANRSPQKLALVELEGESYEPEAVFGSDGDSDSPTEASDPALGRSTG